jgi:hypothetical protein
MQTVPRETYAHDVTSLFRGRWLLMAGPPGDVKREPFVLALPGMHMLLYPAVMGSEIKDKRDGMVNVTG